MKTLIFLLIFKIALSSQAFCLQTFNGYGPIYAPNVQTRTKAFAEKLRKKPCEVLHLQEVWNSSQINLLEQELRRYPSVYSPNKVTKTGLMNFSDFYIYDQAIYVFRHNEDGGLLDSGRSVFGVKKGFTTQSLLVENQLIDFINLHLHPQSQGVRLAQIYEILTWRLHHLDHALILSGDFNMDPLSLEYQFLISTLKLQDAVSKYAPEYCTYCSENSLGWLNTDRVFDYVFFSRNSEWTAKAWEVNLKGAPSARLSDHYGLRVDFERLLEKPNRDIQTEKQNLIKFLTHAMKSLAEKYSKSSDPYRNLGLWKQQLSEEKGLFWDYLNRL